MRIELAPLVGPSGRLMAVERDEQALAAAPVLIQRSRVLSGSSHEGVAAAGLAVTSVQGQCNILSAPPGMRPLGCPRGHARRRHRQRGCDAPWETALARLDSAPVRPTVVAPQFIAIGRRSA